MAYPETGDPPHLNPVNKDPGRSQSASHVNRQNERTVSGTKRAIVSQTDTPKVSTTIEDKESILYLPTSFILLFLQLLLEEQGGRGRTWKAFTAALKSCCSYNQAKPGAHTPQQATGFT